MSDMVMNFNKSRKINNGTVPLQIIRKAPLKVVLDDRKMIGATCFALDKEIDENTSFVKS